MENGGDAVGRGGGVVEMPWRDGNGVVSRKVVEGGG